MPYIMRLGEMVTRRRSRYLRMASCKGLSSSKRVQKDLPDTDTAEGRAGRSLLGFSLMAMKEEGSQVEMSREHIIVVMLRGSSSSPSTYVLDQDLFLAATKVLLALTVQ